MLMQPRKRLALLEQAQHSTAAQVFRIRQLESGVRCGVALEQFEDMSFESGRMALIRMIQKHEAHGGLLKVG
jgi:hypothetical protein